MPEGRGREDISETEDGTAVDPGRYSGKADGKEPGGTPAIEGILLREKTFTQELRQLVDKVTSHDALESVDDENIDKLTEDELIRRYHSLFYHAIHLQNPDEINSTYNPYTSRQDQTGENLISSINAQMTRLSYPGYALLSYHLEKRCFIPVISTISNLDMVNLFVDVNDQIYKRIKTSPKGIIITPDIIENDIFLKKRFASKTAADSDSYYFNSLKNIIAGLISEGSPEAGGEVEDAYFSPIIFIRFKEAGELLNPATITRSLARAMSVQLLYYAYNEMKGIRSENSGGIGHAFITIEYLFRVFMQYTNGRCFVLTRGDDFSAERRFAISYFLSKLRASVSMHTMLAQIENHRIIIFTTDKDSALIDAQISAWNRIFADIFRIRIYDNKNKISFLDFLKDFVF